MNAQIHCGSASKSQYEIATLQQLSDGWKGENSKRPAENAVAQLQTILFEIETGRMPWPDVHAVPNGGVVLTWTSLCRDMMVTIDPDGKIFFTTCLKQLNSDYDVVERVESEGFVADMQTLDYMLVWFCKDKAHAT